LSGGGFNPVEEPMPLSPLLMAGLSSSASAGAIGRISGRCAFDFGVLDPGDLPGFLGVSGFFAMAAIWDRNVRHERAGGGVAGDVLGTGTGRPLMAQGTNKGAETGSAVSNGQQVGDDERQMRESEACALELAARGLDGASCSGQLRDWRYRRLRARTSARRKIITPKKSSRR
jgi:hypothetical protein